MDFRNRRPAATVRRRPPAYMQVGSLHVRALIKILRRHRVPPTLYQIEYCTLHGTPSIRRGHRAYTEKEKKKPAARSRLSLRTEHMHRHHRPTVQPVRVAWRSQEHRFVIAATATTTDENATATDRCRTIARAAPAFRPAAVTTAAAIIVIVSPSCTRVVVVIVAIVVLSCTRTSSSSPPPPPLNSRRKMLPTVVF